MDLHASGPRGGDALTAHGTPATTEKPAAAGVGDGLAVPRHHDLAPLAAGLLLLLVAVTLRHPFPLLLLLLAVWPLAPRPRWPLGALAAAGFVMNGLFSWHGATVLWRAPFTLALLGRPRITAEALASGLVTGLQIALAAVALLWALSRVAPQAVARLLPGQGPRTAAFVALRALPDTVRDARAMQVALAARGIDAGGARGAGHLLVPLTARSLDRAADTTALWHARGGGAKPRRAVPLRWGWRGAGAFLLATAWLAMLATDHAPNAVFLPRIEMASWTAWSVWAPMAALAIVPWRGPP